MNIIGDVEGKNILIVDDLVDTAGTLCNAVRGAEEGGGDGTSMPPAPIPCSRARRSSGSTASGLKKMLVTDTFPLKRESPKIEVETVATFSPRRSSGRSSTSRSARCSTSTKVNQRHDRNEENQHVRDRVERRTSGPQPADMPSIPATKGMIPGVYYARGEENIAIQVPKVGLDTLVFTSETHVIDLRSADGTAEEVHPARRPVRSDHRPADPFRPPGTEGEREADDRGPRSSSPAAFRRGCATAACCSTSSTS